MVQVQPEKKVLWFVLASLFLGSLLMAHEDKTKKNVLAPQVNPRTDVSDIFPDLHTKKVGEEIEVKIKLDDAQYKTLLDWLEQHAQKEKEVHQKDVYYDKAKPEDSFFFFRDVASWNCTRYQDALRSVRIRYSGNKIIVNTKLRHIDATGALISCDEFEQPKTQAEAEDFKKLLALNGYVEKITIEKDRTIYNVNHIEIAIDKVKGLDGVFIELELKKANISTQRGKKMLYDLLLDRGIWTFYQYTRGYLAILLNPGCNFEKLVMLEHEKKKR